jgi:glycosyltransferase involved in cell wall biosynthesis
MGNSNVIVRESDKAYKGTCDYLENELGFNSLLFGDGKDKDIIISKKEALKNSVKAMHKIYRKKAVLKNSDIILSIGNYTTVFLLILNKLNIIKPKKIFWWGFFIHSKKIQKILRLALPLLKKKNLKIILFSECEKQMYTKALNLPEKIFVSIPYGDWSGAALTQDAATVGVEEDYYFSGGYSNRNYEKLINAWNNSGIKQKLVIIGSKNNKDLAKYVSESTNSYITVFTDTSSDTFEKYLIGAKACILPFKENTGASGQSVTLRCMRLNKLIISDDTDIMREYVITGETGILLKDMKNELSNVINNIENGVVNKKDLTKKSNDLFKKKFSYKVITEKLKVIVEG